jgi:hypothetical protein
MIKNLYPPVNYSPGQELAPSTPCRVASGSLEPDLSPLLYKPKSV